MSLLSEGQVKTTASVDPAGKNLCKIGGFAALAMVVIYFIAMAVYFPAYSRGPPPASVSEWLTLFGDEPITGLFFLGLADALIDVLWVPVSLALLAALWRSNKSAMLIATAFAFVGIAAFLATNTAFSMLSLSHEYAAATTDAQRSLVEAAGQALIATGQGTGYYAGALVWAAALIVSIVMLRSGVFGKTTALIGVLGFTLLLIGIPFSTYTSYSPAGPGPLVTAIIAIQYAGGGILSMAWYFLVGRRLIKLSRHAVNGEKI